VDSTSDNSLFTLAADAVNFTGCNIFLTGKAGTGKTTFLKHIRQHSHKNTVVVAPTGVAAINAGGVTMHSFFQLPFLPFLPEKKYSDAHVQSVDRYTLIKNIRFSRDKIELLKELELLIIDEVSMLRADMLDAIDEVLRHFRGRRSAPFGGVQVLFIGDLFQLPPVVSDAEWAMMSEQYKSPFFFSAGVLEENPPMHIELKKIYRQSDEKFISLLNNIRNNEMEEEDYLLLEKRRLPETADMKRDCITLTTHNYMADDINRKELEKLKAKIFHFEGALTGNFSEKALPTEMQLELKKGAQIMFVKNDSNPAKRYFNGKLAIVKKIDSDGIVVSFSDSQEELKLEKEKWKSVRYALNKESGKVEEEELGSFTQYPIRLAWAITIHKSQGLTFDHAVIDAGKSFAPGQVYVALSRCRNLEGLYLLSQITNASVKSDLRIVDFSRKENAEYEIKNRVLDEKPKYAAQILIKTFDWDNLCAALEAFLQETENKKFDGKVLAFTMANNLALSAKAQQTVAQNFISQLDKKFNEPTLNLKWLEEKVVGAKKYFVSKLKEELIAPVHLLQAQLKGKTKVRKYSNQVSLLENILYKKISDIERAAFGDLTFTVEKTNRAIPSEIESPKSVSDKKIKGSSRLETLAFYKEGMSVSDIAKQRDMAITTIEGHLAEFVKSGKVSIFDFISKPELEKIKAARKKLEEDRLTPLKNELGDAFSYGKIRMALGYLQKDKAS